MGQRPGATRAITLAVLTSLGATAARASDDPETLDTVTVTAQRFSQNLQEVPIAVTAIGAEQLELLGVAELKDVTFGNSGEWMTPKKQSTPAMPK